MEKIHFISRFNASFGEKFCPAMSGNRTRVNCLEGSYAHHYTNIARMKGESLSHTIIPLAVTTHKTPVNFPSLLHSSEANCFLYLLYTIPLRRKSISKGKILSRTFLALICETAKSFYLRYIHIYIGAQVGGLQISL